MKVRTALVITALASLMGCTTTAKPELTDVGYKQYATWLAGGELCAIRGYTQPSLVAFGKTHLTHQLAAYSYSPERLNDEVAKTIASATSAEPPVEACNAMALRIAEIKQQRELNMADAVEQQRSEDQTLDMLRNNNPKVTSCNKYGAQVLCNTY